MASTGRSPLANDPTAETWLRHIDHLAREIGPRGPTTPNEARAAEYAHDVFERAGLETRVEVFRSSTSGFLPFTLGIGIALLAVLVYPVAGRLSGIAALAVFSVTIVSLIREADLRANPLRMFFPKRGSQNVWARVPPAQGPRRRVVVMGHLDTNRTPLLFTPRWLWLLRAAGPIGFLAITALAVLLVRGVILETRTAYLVSLIPVALTLPLLLLMLQSDLTPYTPGANDNATGSGLLLTLAERLRSEPLQATEVWLVATGCEEAGCCGAKAFFRAHRPELVDSQILVVDMVGGAGAGPCYLRSEGAVLPHRYDPGLLSLADSIAMERPELGAYSRRIRVGFTEGLPAMQAGLRALTLCGLTPKGELPHWHQETDTVDKIDLGVLALNYAFVMELLSRIDGEDQEV